MREPVEDAPRTERIPPARLALAVLHLEVGLARVDVLERPPAVGIPIALDDPDRLGNAFLGLDLGAAQVEGDLAGTGDEVLDRLDEWRVDDRILDRALGHALPSPDGRRSTIA